MAYSADGLGGVSRIFHKTLCENIVRGEWKKKRRPVLINNWEGTYFDFTGDRLVSIAKEAHELGVELFVMDDGWFGKRDSDNSGLGDWHPNEEKLGCSLKQLGERITAEGMLFGIWFEPECVSMDSDLYRAHPDWAVQIPGRKPNLSRNQLVLDFSRKEVQDYLTEQIASVLESAPVNYVNGILTEASVINTAMRCRRTDRGKWPIVIFWGCTGSWKSWLPVSRIFCLKAAAGEADGLTPECFITLRRSGAVMIRMP